MQNRNPETDDVRFLRQLARDQLESKIAAVSYQAKAIAVQENKAIKESLVKKSEEIKEATQKIAQDKMKGAAVLPCERLSLLTLHSIEQPWKILASEKRPIPARWCLVLCGTHYTTVIITLRYSSSLTASKVF
jgi:hypothetical protein